jgi:P4 family phage/plasmid primase-like protien
MALRKFLNARRSTTNFTHLSLDPNGKYSVKPEDLPLLYGILAADAAAGAAPHHLLETHEGLTAGPLLVDLDFEYPDEPRFHTHQYTREHIEKFVEFLHQGVTHFFGPVEDVEYVVSEKPAPTIEAGKRVKDGIHVLARGLILSYTDQHTLRLYALQKHFLQNAFNMEYVRNTPDAVYDECVISRNSWYLLGCSKPGRDPYMPTLAMRAEDGDLETRQVEAACYSIPDLSIRCGGEARPVLAEQMEEWRAVEESAAGVKKKEKKANPKKGIVARIDPDSASQGAGIPIIPFSDMTGGRPAFPQSIEILEKLVSLWSPKRADNYAGWRNCVFCIAACGKECGNVEAAMDIAYNYVLASRGEANCDVKKVLKVFMSEKRSVLGFVVAHQWARADNLAGYMQCGFSVWWKIPWAHFTVAREFFGMYPETFLLVDEYWYVFNGVYWERDSANKGDSKTIKKWLSTQFYDTLYEQIKTQREVIEGGEYQKKLGFLSQLLNKSFKNDVLSELGQFYSNSAVKFDARPELFAFNNRVYDLSTCAWVEPRASMYISLTCGYDYHDVSDADITEMEDWVSQLFDSREKTEYVLKMMASCLYRHNRDEKAHFLLGRGRNGKGTLKEMMSAALGGYAGKMDLSYFTQADKHCGSANPHLYNLRNARVIWCDEAETDGRIVGKFSTNKLKTVTGRDKLKARPLYSGDEAEFEIGHFVALVNEMPSFTSFDYALMLRLVCVRFPYVFVPASEFRADDPTHRRQDPRIKERVMERRNVFIALLLRWYVIYDSEKELAVPECVRADTRKITDELDAVGGWAREAMEFKANERPPLSVVYAKYMEDMERESKEYVKIAEFGKRMNRYFDLRICRNGDKDEFNQVNRVINYRLKVV